MTQPSQKFPIYAIIFGTLSLTLFFTIFFFNAAMTTSKKLPVLGQVAAFKMTDSEENTFTSAQLRGKVWVANFFFTTCSDICPMMSKHMLILHKSFILESGLMLVSFSVNPEFDNAAVLKTYAKKYEADTKKWIFLTAKREEIQKLAIGSFKMGAINEPVFHSSYFALVDRNGYIRGYYDGTKEDYVNTLYTAAKILLKERW